jgi:uncharacterized protein HemY
VDWREWRVANRKGSRPGEDTAAKRALRKLFHCQYRSAERLWTRLSGQVQDPVAVAGGSGHQLDRTDRSR